MRACRRLRGVRLTAVVLLAMAATADAQSLTSFSDPHTPLSGSVRASEATPGTLFLSLNNAVERGLQWNLGVLLSRERILASVGQRRLSVSTLLPRLSLTSSVNVQQLNVQAQEGIHFPGLPSVIGPFANFDARLRLTQSIFDWPAFLRVRADRDEVQAARHSYRDVREQVVLAVGTAYFQTIAHAARLQSAEAQRDTARALHDQAVDRLKAGTAAAIDVLRASVQLRSHEQQLIAARNDFAKQKVVLARLIGLPLEQSFTVTDEQVQRPAGVIAAEDALRDAYGARADLQALLTEVQSLEVRRKAASAGSLPALSASVDYGAVGVTPASFVGTVDGFVGVTIPLFQGERVRGEVAQADAAVAQRRAHLENLRGQIEQDVRSALLDLESAADQVDVARSMVDLADQTLQQARDRFTAGVSDNVEVVQAQEALARASETLIVSRYLYNVALLTLARATGSAETSLLDLPPSR
jgi:outer membrane protein TolC